VQAFNNPTLYELSSNGYWGLSRHLETSSSDQQTVRKTICVEQPPSVTSLPEQQKQVASDSYLASWQRHDL
jgi:hypothetical protein